MFVYRLGKSKNKKCINQKDIKDKEQQIPLMRMIYLHATNTVIWLGNDGEPEVALAFETLQVVHTRLQLSEHKITPEDLPRIGLPPENDRAWWAVRQLFRKEWFSRTWTIQEARLSRLVFIQCGKTVASWDDVAVGCTTLHHTGLHSWLVNNEALDHEYAGSGKRDISEPSGGITINMIEEERLTGPASQNHGILLWTLVATRSAKATDLRDKVYGVLGLVETDIIPDYSLENNHRNVYHSTCLSQMSKRAHSVLSCIDHDAPLKPSWVPDWSSPRVTESLAYSTRTWPLYYAGGKQEPGKMSYGQAVISKDTRTATFRGKVFDEIVTLGHICEDPDLHINDPSFKNKDLTKIFAIANATPSAKHYPHPTSSPYDAFMQTLLAGRDGRGEAPPTCDHSDVFSLVLDKTTARTPPSLPGQPYSVRRQKGHFTLESLKSRKPAKTLEDLRVALRAALTMRRFAVTGRGYFALAPRGARVGDQLVVLRHAAVPFVVRRAGEGSGYVLLGEAYVHGIMHGEVVEMGDLEVEDVNLV